MKPVVPPRDVMDLMAEEILSRDASSPTDHSGWLSGPASPLPQSTPQTAVMCIAGKRQRVQWRAQEHDEVRAYEVTQEEEDIKQQSWRACVERRRLQKLARCAPAKAAIGISAVSASAFDSALLCLDELPLDADEVDCVAISDSTIHTSRHAQSVGDSSRSHGSMSNFSSQTAAATAAAAATTAAEDHLP